MLIKVFGPGCPKCEEAAKIVSEAVKEAGMDATVEKVSDFKEMMAYGIMSTPAVSINGKVVRSGHVPTKAEVMDWLRENDAAKG